MTEKLGPIHYMMYSKIKKQDQLSDNLLAGQTQDLDREYPPVSTDPLEELIDQDNVHGWLSSRIDMVENRLARAIDLAEEPLERAHEFGKKEASGESLDSYQELFNKLNIILLDGMPCDNGLTAEIVDGDLYLVTNTDLHSKYYEEKVDPSSSLGDTCAGGHDHDEHPAFEVGEADDLDLVEAKIASYYDVREALIKGFLEDSPYQVERIKNSNFRIYKA